MKCRFWILTEISIGLFLLSLVSLISNSSGQPIPYVEYTETEIATWRAVYVKVVELLPGRACTIHRLALDHMMKECGFSADNIPQMEDVSNYLKSISISKPTKPS